MPDGTLVKDVQIGKFQMPWEKKTDFWKWATHDSGMEQVGTVYTAQGFEFDYIAVIFGKDLVYAQKTKSWDAAPAESFDTQVARNNPDLAEHLKSVYRVLLSRAHKGVYVYFMDQKTRKYFEENIGRSAEAEKRSEAESLQGKPRLMLASEVPASKKFNIYLPVYSFPAAAGTFGKSQGVESQGWVPAAIGRPLSKDMFVAQVKGLSMEPTIQDGSYCIFKFERGGSRNEKIVLVESRHVDDPDNGGEYTVKRYFSEKLYFDDGTWRHKKITLVPDNHEFGEIVLENVDPTEFRVIAEFVSCL